MASVTSCCDSRGRDAERREIFKWLRLADGISLGVIDTQFAQRLQGFEILHAFEERAQVSRRLRQ